MRRRVLIIGVVLMMVLSLAACMGNASTDDAAKILTEVKTTQFFSDENIADADVDKILSAGVNAPSAMNTQPWHFTAVTDKEVTAKLGEAMKNMKPPARPEGMERKMPPEGAPQRPEGGFTPPNGDFAPPEGFTPPEGTDRKMPPEGAPQSPEGMPKDAPQDMPKPPEGGAGFAKMPNKAGIGDAPLTIVISCAEGSELDAGLAVQNMSAEAQLLGYGTKIMTAPTMALNTDEYKSMLSIPDGQKIAAVLIVGKPATAEETPDAVASATTRNAFEDVVTIIGR